MVDLRSDTLTRPTEAMLAAMRQATYGDETLFGDETVKRLEEKAAALVGKEAALFMPSGTMGNLAAVFAHKRGGVEMVVDRLAHIGKTEFGGVSVAAGLHCVRIPSHRGEMDLDALHDTARVALTRQTMPPALICMESSHNHSGGCVPSLAYMREVHALGNKIGSPVHLDGARLFNSAVALGVPASDIVAHCDSVSFCVSKGLSAPYGALLAGSRDCIARAHIFRRMLGGGMRQIGVMAAAAIVALDTMTERLADDHRRAKNLWEKLRALDVSLTDADPPMTNIVHVHCKGGDAEQWLARLTSRGVLAMAKNAVSLRLTTHRHIDDAGVDAAIDAVRACRV